MNKDSCTVRLCGTYSRKRKWLNFGDKCLHSPPSFIFYQCQMIKRSIFILVLLTISFFIYRKINPEAANKLIHKVRTTYNNILGRTWSLISEELTTNSWLVLSGDIGSGVLFTGDALTGLVQTGWLMVNGEEEQVFTGNTVTSAIAPCGAEGDLVNETLGWPANCCQWLQAFSTGQGMRMRVDPGQLCYNPTRWIPRCDKDGTDKEGRYSSWILLTLDDCMTTTKTTTPPATSTTTTKTNTTPSKPKTTSDLKATQNLINGLFK